ncbi:hypothetical protein CBP76_04070 [Companilactobacillus nuruki]|uniref:DUF3862 domain-containing protein n=2 Tax=Companilactobacillus nuruki TaxID=1993540 RepID=A0A2N7AVJ8_9LACO|nr:hypothetical protein CBP76_04070 [Companilactobacillus nuruki]
MLQLIKYNYIRHTISIFNENKSALIMLLSSTLDKIVFVNGGMKMMNENERKPFYRRNWFWITILSIFIVVSATTYVANYSFYQGKADQASISQSKNVAKKKAKKSPSFIEKYNSIKTGKNSLNKTDVINLLGQPNSTQQIDADSKLYNLTWNGTENDNDISIQITFSKDRVISKSIQGLNIDRAQLLTTEDFNKVQTGDNYNHVLNTLGDPDDYSEDNGIKTLTYESNLSEIDSTQDAFIKIEFSNNEVIYKYQQNLK